MGHEDLSTTQRYVRVTGRDPERAMARLKAPQREACYVKEVDPDERIVRFWQEMYNENGVLVERHDKYPVDRGHVRVRE